MTLNLENRFCALCGPTAGKKVKFKATFDPSDLSAEVFSARRAPDRKHFRLVECETCGMIYSDPACDPSLLADLYGKSAVTYGAQESQIYASYEPVLDRALKGLKSRRAFLEIGGGSGFMLRYGADRGFERQIEIEPSADGEARFVPPTQAALFVRGILEPGTIPAGSISLACFFQMLDHVPSPLEFLKTVYDALEPGGVAVCVTHDTAALSARLLRGRSPIYDIEHTYLFNRQNLAKLFARAGFSRMDGFEIANRYALRHWLNLSPLPPGAKASLLAGLEKVRLADRRLQLRAGNFAMIGRKPL